MPDSHRSILLQLLQHLKQDYPDSHLLTEFVTYQGNEYAVRALIKMGDTVLATGMSASSNLETAEDQAKVRALETFGLQPSGLEPEKKRPLKPVPFRADASPQVSTSLSDPVVQDPVPEPTLTHHEDANKHTYNLASPDHKNTAPPTDANPGTDLSDAIAKTSVEMRRLGWDTQHGRQHLQVTYGKRSRGELTDEELLDFLQFLESQAKE